MHAPQPAATLRHRYSQSSSKPSTHRIDWDMARASLNDSNKLFFDERSAFWIDATQYESSLTQITQHPKFSELLAMGDVALRLTLARMNQGEVRIHWFPLLKRIANADPVPAHDRGFVDRMTRHWLEWAREHGKL